MLVIMWVPMEWQHYLLGAQSTFKIWTDHKNIEYFQAAHHLNCWQAHWALELAEHDFTHSHKLGCTNQCPDALSHYPDYYTGDQDNSDTVLLKLQWFHTLIILLTVQTEGDPLLERIRGTKKIEKQIWTYLNAVTLD